MTQDLTKHEVFYEYEGSLHTDQCCLVPVILSRLLFSFVDLAKQLVCELGRHGVQPGNQVHHYSSLGVLSSFALSSSGGRKQPGQLLYECDW